MTFVILGSKGVGQIAVTQLQRHVRLCSPHIRRFRFAFERSRSRRPVQCSGIRVT